ncbi:hypothetical protein [Dickeya poaceiphila]|uniref:Uncharacterized protein n=1 Tax=Dickeya poaceiphila TaxID=568768 RepID=A0A5B8HDV4_9GAMM|nr:hypothetical protein [Dickeya poaceiphila]QDX28509.1 hypothetical protein Dpoa569_0000143 [Dickeya poaceiphila]
MTMGVKRSFVYQVRYLFFIKFPMCDYFNFNYYVLMQMCLGYHDAGVAGRFLALPRGSKIRGLDVRRLPEENRHITVAVKGDNG